MKILVLTQYFWPESFIINDFVKGLVAEGHSVTVATGKPNYPSGKIFPGYESSGMQIEKYTPEIDVVRIPLRPRGTAGGLALARNYFSFVFWGLLFFPYLLRNRKFDHIMVFAPSPIFQTIPAILLKLIKRASLSIWVQDLWPDTLLATGFVKNRVAIWMVTQVVRIIYFFTDYLLAQSEAFRGPLEKLADSKKIIYFPNCFLDQFSKKNTERPVPGIPTLGATAQKTSPPQPELPQDFKKYLKDHFCFLFAGNFGSAQGLESIIAAAEILQKRAVAQPETIARPESAAVAASRKIGIVLVGSGSLSPWIEEQVRTKKLENIFLAGRYPMDQMPQIYREAQVLLVTLKDHPTLHLTIPSKIQAYLAAKKPILGALPGEGARILSESQGALVVAPDDPVQLADAMIKFLTIPPEQIQSMSDNAYAYFLRHFEMSTQVKLFGSLFHKG